MGTQKVPLDRLRANTMHILPATCHVHWHAPLQHPADAKFGAITCPRPTGLFPPSPEALPPGNRPPQPIWSALSTVGDQCSAKMHAGAPFGRVRSAAADHFANISSPSGECAPLPGPQELPRFPATRPRTTPEGQKTAVRSPRTAPDREQEFLPRWRQPPAAADPTDKRPTAPGQGQGAPTWAACCSTLRPLRGHHQNARSGIASQPGCPRTPARAGARRPSTRPPRAVGV